VKNQPNLAGSSLLGLISRSNGASRGWKNPALRVRVLAPLLPIIGDDTLLHQLREVVNKILAALPPDSRQTFEQAPVLSAALTGRF
jgi:hypothetical protein